MRRPLLLLALLLSVAPLAACGGATERSVTYGESPLVCPEPSLELDATSCPVTALEGYGESPQRPLEWGRGALGTLWFGRLMCEGGASPDVRRVGSVGAAPEPSNAPASGVPNIGEDLGQGDILDRWEVRCPGEEARVLYANTYRCGDACPPPGLSLMGADASALLTRSRVAYEAGDAESAIDDAREAAALLQTPSERVSAWLGVVLAGDGDGTEALPHLDEAIRINPDETRYVIFAAMVELNASRFEDARKRTADLIRRLPPDHEAVAEARCVKAAALINLNRHDEASLLRYEACQGGFDSCCE